MTLNIMDVLTSLERTAEQFLSRDELKRRLRSGKPQRIKYTIDVKTDDLHIGHAVNLRMIRKLQDLGHKAVIVFTDYTSHAGDYDGQLHAISTYPEKVLERKIVNLTAQAKLILRGEANLLEIRRNSEWYATMSLHEIMGVLSLVTHTKLASRDIFQMAIEGGQDLYVNEMLYPILQGYDSYKVMSDIAIIGTDQMFNESIGHLIQVKHKKKPQTFITTRMTPGIDGRSKQSERRDNQISLAHSSRDKFGRVMSIPDELILDYFLVYTDVAQADLNVIRDLLVSDPREAKARLATEIVEMYHGTDAAAAERDWFENTIARGYAPEDMPTLFVSTEKMETLDLVVLARPDKSHSDSSRLVKQGGVELNGRKLRLPDQELVLKTNDILQVGKRLWYRIEIRKIGTLDSRKLSMRPAELEDIEQIIARLPSLEMARYLLRRGPDDKVTLADINHALKRMILQPGTAQEVMMVATSKDDPARIAGFAHMNWHAGEQTFWMDTAFGGPTQAMTQELGEMVINALGLEVRELSDSFNVAYTAESVTELQKRLNPVMLSRDDPYGIPNMTREAWDNLQQWRRFRAPWLMNNDTTQSRHNLAAKRRNPLPGAPAPSGHEDD